ncbi:MAG: Holliday junction branch migration DNA helicase RuvB [Elusimicrobiota bacterium]|jgi:Holliday junction DNA helicase RuvB|nr:Holliday junction branch migration DNA helicase RuvB [Elusimicrobiota bacterium]
MDAENLRKTLETSKLDEDEKTENYLRPQSLDDFIGQEKLKENLRVFISAAKKREEALDHCLFYAPPGLGKTTLSHIIAKEMGSALISITGPGLDKKGDLAAILTNMNKGDVFFIDEIHRLNHTVEEYLYPAMEDFELDVIIGQGPSAKTIKLPLQHFTLVGATTRAGLLSSPLRDRFGIIGHLDFYNTEELIQIINRSSAIMNIEIEQEARIEIAKRSRGTPRIVNRLLRRIRDFAEIGGGIITLAIAKSALLSLEVDNAGLDKMDRLLLTTIAEKFSGGPVGVETLAIAISEDSDTIMDIYEPFLIQSGFLARTPRGRVLTEEGYKHIGAPMPKSMQGRLI